MSDQPRQWFTDEGRHDAATDARPAVDSKQWAFRIVSCLIATVFSTVLLFAFLQIRERMRPIRFADGIPGSGVELIYDARLGWRNAPQTETTTFGQPVTINAHGHRGPDRPIRKPVGTRRILVLGDSFTWGYNVSDSDVFASVLEQKLRGTTTPWEVINTGVSGWGTTQEYLYLIDEGFQYSPEVVVLAVFLGNDLTNNAASPEYGRHKPVFLDTTLRLANVPVPKPWDNAPPVKARSDSLDLMVAIIRKMAEACGKHECRLVVMKFGNYVEPNNYDHKQIARRFEEGVSDCLNLRYMNLDMYFADHEITMRELVAGSQQLHWNAFGHSETAQALFEFLETENLLTQ